MNALIVEDHEATSENLAAICREEFGCTVCQATDLVSAHTAITGQEFDLITWDFNLPDGTTLELIRLARAKFPNATMIATSSLKDKRQEEQEAGCNLSADAFDASNVLRETLAKLCDKKE